MSFFKSAESWFARMFGGAPKWNTIAKSTLLVVAPLIKTIVLLADPEAEPAVAGLLDKIQMGLAAAGAVLDGAGPTANLPSILDSITGNLTQLEGAFQVKNPDTAKQITAITNTVAGELKAILAIIPATTSAPASPSPNVAQGAASTGVKIA